MSKPGRDNARDVASRPWMPSLSTIELLENPTRFGGKPYRCARADPRSVVCSASRRRAPTGFIRACLGCALSRFRTLRSFPCADWSHSRAVMGILRQPWPLVEQVSVDEAFVDLYGRLPARADPVQLARQAREPSRGNSPALLGGGGSQ